MKNFTKQELFEDVRLVLLAFADCLQRVLTTEVSGAVLGISDRDQSDPGIADVNLERYCMTRALDCLYDYAFEARRPVDLMYLDDCEDTVLFFQGLANFGLLDESSHYMSGCLEKILYTLRVAHARFALDDGDAHTPLNSFEDVVGPPVKWGVISLQEVALLAGMDEKSVRNAANKNNTNRLKTFNQGQGTYVYVEDARTWLEGRRGFKLTVYYDSTLDRDLTKVGFYSASDLARYLKGQREKKAMSITAVIAAMGLPEANEDKLQELENGSFHFDQDFYAGLAQVYDLDIRALVLAGLVLGQRLERARIEMELEQRLGEADAPSGANSEVHSS